MFVHKQKRTFMKLRCNWLQLERRSYFWSKNWIIKVKIKHIKYDDCNVAFFTGYPIYRALEAFSIFRTRHDALSYFCKHNKGSLCEKHVSIVSHKYYLHRNFHTLIYLLEQDFAYCYGISQSTVSRIIITWINFLFLKLKEILLWPPRALIKGNIPENFKSKYPTTRVILIAT